LRPEQVRHLGSVSTPVNAREFYDSLAETYDLFYRDWDEEITRQAQAILELLPDFAGSVPRLLDCSCGIGTQALGLASGRHVVATDLSLAAVNRARVESLERKLALAFAVADMRHLPFSDSNFDAVICFDNSLPHLTTQVDLDAGLGEMARVLRNNGTLLISVRDYDDARRLHPPSTPPSIRDTPEGRFITFQIWHWLDDGERYKFEHVQLEHVYPEEWRLHRRVTTYWALTRAQITSALRAAGLTSIEWFYPAQTGYFQPVVRAKKPPQTAATL